MHYCLYCGKRLVMRQRGGRLHYAHGPGDKTACAKIGYEREMHRLEEERRLQGIEDAKPLRRIRMRIHNI